MNILKPDSKKFHYLAAWGPGYSHWDIACIRWDLSLQCTDSPVGVHGLSSWGARALQLGCTDSPVGVHGLSSWGARALQLGCTGSVVVTQAQLPHECGIFVT